MDHRLAKFLASISRLRRTSHFLVWLIRILRSFFMAATMLYVWSAVHPHAQHEQILLALLTFLLGMLIGANALSADLNADSVLKSLEVKYPQCPVPAFSLRQDQPANAAWQEYLNRERAELNRFEFDFLRFKATTVILPLLFFLIASQLSPKAFSTALISVKKVVAELNRGASLTVVEGLAEEGAEDSFDLTNKRLLELTLLEQNMVEVKVVGLQNEAPFVTLKPIGESLDYVQTFRLTAVGSDDPESESWLYKVSFNIQDDAEIFVSSLSASQPVASIQVQRLPVPEVHLDLAADMQDPWPDDQPLPLLIRAKGTHPLQMIRLKIRVEGQEYQELVNNILATDKMEVNTNYSILLESYTRQDLSEVEIVAEAIDRHLPNPLLGQSRPLVIRSASAYGRYRTTLQTLREIKQGLDLTINDDLKALDPEIAKLTEKAASQAEDSPFFDGLDRHLIRSMQLGIEGMMRDFDKEELLRVSEELNRFLFEHETLDDRERDRDFFVAARSLSRVIEQSKEERRLSVETVTDRLKTFLNERQIRWQVRTNFLGDELTPKTWAEVQKGKFQAAMEEIRQRSAKSDQAGALETLSQTVADYRSWIEELENAEDKKRRDMESQRQQGLADARNNLRDLQKRQGKISQELDRAASRSQEELAEKWAGVRMEQNANIKGTSSLEAQLRSLSPLAAERIKAALKSMELTVEAGNQQAYAQAESSSDFAGRLLRQADSAARQSQQQRQGRGRRRRVTSDQYYGSPVAGGDVDIRREYRVNPRYREDILNQVRRASQGESEDDRLLERYLRKIIR